MNKYEESKLICWATRPGSVARNQPFMSYAAKNGVKYNLTIPLEKIIIRYCAEEKSWKKMLKKMLNSVLRDVSGHLQDYDKSKEVLLKKAKILGEKAGRVSARELLKLQNSYFREAFHYSLYLFLPFALSEYLEPEIYQKFPDDFQVITNPDRLNIYQEMSSELLNNDLDEVYKKYKWLNLYSVHELPSQKSFFADLKSKINRTEQNEITLKIDKNKKAFQKFIKKVNSQADKNKCNLLHSYAYLRTDRIDTWKRAMYFIQPFYLFLAKNYPRKSCALSEMVNISNDEIKEILLRNQYPSRRELQKRLNRDSLVYYFNNKVNFIYDKKEIENIKKRLEDFNKITTEIKGFVANKGKVRGRAVIINFYRDLNKVKRGDVMVAIVTNPSYMQYMKNISAIVTDEGGITCHAAIVSRELGIPCIIGTKVATKVLKDGDSVEVNADKGIVKILNKEK